MILSDKDIKRYIDKGSISINPQPEIEGSSVDLTLADKFKRVVPNAPEVPEHEESTYIDPKYQQNIVNISLDDDMTFMIHPGEMILAATNEYIKIDGTVSAFVQGRSSYARMGLAIEIAGYVDSGFEGTITLEMVNTSKYPIKLYPGEKICQIIFMPMSSEPDVPYNKKKSAKYMGQIDPEESRIVDELK